MEERAKSRGCALCGVFLVPTRAQAAMISMGEWPAGYDPYKLDDELRAIVTSHGGIYIDILPDFRNIPNPEQYYLSCGWPSRCQRPRDHLRSAGQGAYQRLPCPHSE